MNTFLKKWTSERSGWVFLLGALAFGLLVFRVLLLPGAILFTTDDNVGALALRKTALPYLFLGGWYDAVLVGMPQYEALNWTNLLLWILPAGFFTNFIHAADLILMSVFLGLFLRERGQGWAACALGALTACWVGSNFTLTYAGHIGKFGVMMFAALSLWLIEKAAKNRSPAWAVLAGGALGGMFLEQADVALFVVMFLAPYALFAVIREHGWNVPALFKVLLPMGVLTMLMAFCPLWMGYRTSVQGMTNVTQEDPKERWDFSTQWSWPPEESIDFVAPGFMGWRSGEPEGPYYGRMGRSADWETTRQGFQNFKLENHYMGAIPVLMAIWAVFAAWISRRQKAAWRSDVWFWSAALLAALLLSFGKYFPLYRLFYLLPMVSSIRNPNKFLHVFQLAAGVLAAYGLDVLLRRNGPADLLKDVSAALIKRFALIAGGVAAFFLLWGLVASASEVSLLTRFAGWGAYASVIVKNRAWALLHAAFMTAVGAGAIFWFTRPAAGKSRRGAWVLIVVVALDALFLARHYVSAMPPNLIQENEVVKFIKSRQQYQRTALVSQESFYNAWLTYVFPYYGIRTMNFTQMPRMPEDYKRFLGQVGPQVFNLWRLAACEWIAGPAGFWGQIQADPNLKNSFELAYAFNAFPDPLGGVRFTTATAASPGQHVIAHLKIPSPRYGLIDRWEVQTSDDETLKTLASPMFAPLSKALLAPDTTGIPAAVAGDGLTGAVTVKAYRPGQVRLQVSSEKTAILRAAERYDPDWKAWVDGRPAPVHRVDYLFQGVFVEPGIHEVVLSFSPERWPFMVQSAGLLLCAGSAIWVVLQQRRKAQTA
ncbi:MAG TPA: hypothetical protein DCZ95_18560 [Verrucomicrobia bacterium]|nr:MAG: hypothetical protein A2X46_16710 [Lentisphaerae bacterium GWF2_57_35]HBA86091.1 hypothetical protein [Verrucomicrobiota bacterium]